jgi:ribosomal protein L31
MARKKNIHENYSEVKFTFLNNEAEPIMVCSTLNTKEKTISKSINSHKAWQKDRKKVISQQEIKKRFDIDLL